MLDSFGRRALKSNGPSDVSSDVWSSMTPKEKKECIEHYAKLAKDKSVGSDKLLEFIAEGVVGSGEQCRGCGAGSW